ncbi:PREDICTED: retinol dehydrogenase 13-like [Branchiostoma belcheri]|uniref:Retinol dehydrogenase 13-like n=1 Tax=Branchiostoma belcheri TaxID=7741 RepID=A0A6P5B082_BRABE|nr:PREDICTED: retinol dehydrogenase 13-like [Branchiostoma belcheri]
MADILPRLWFPLSAAAATTGIILLIRDYVHGERCPSKATMEGKTVIITGANSGIGKETAKELSKRGGRVIMACRNMDKCKEALDELVQETGNKNVHCQHVDLASFESVRKFANRINKSESKVDVLINNAGVMRCPHWKTADGNEWQFQVNYLSHFLLTNLILDKLKAAEQGRIINTSSIAHGHGKIKFDDINSKDKYDDVEAYSQSKLALVLFSLELSNRLEGTGVTANTVYPGVTKTNIGQHKLSKVDSVVTKPFMWFTLREPARAAQTGIYLSVAPEVADKTGKYWKDTVAIRPAPQGNNEEVAKKLWDLSLKMTGLPEDMTSNDQSKEEKTS